MFLRHEGFLGALGAFMSNEKHGLDDLMVHQLVERFPMGAPYIGGKIHGPPLGDLNEKAIIITFFYLLSATKLFYHLPCMLHTYALSVLHQSDCKALC